MNRWLQAKTYRCPSYGATYLHDKAHPHAAYECPALRLDRGEGGAPSCRERALGVRRAGTLAPSALPLFP